MKPPHFPFHNFSRLRFSPFVLGPPVSPSCFPFTFFFFVSPGGKRNPPPSHDTGPPCACSARARREFFFFFPHLLLLSSVFSSVRPWAPFHTTTRRCGFSFFFVSQTRRCPDDPTPLCRQAQKHVPGASCHLPHKAFGSFEPFPPAPIFFPPPPRIFSRSLIFFSPKFSVFIDLLVKQPTWVSLVLHGAETAFCLGAFPYPCLLSGKVPVPPANP